jgi:hypothetical protein
VVTGPREGDTIPRLKALALSACLLALLALVAVPPAHAQVTGGPIIDAAVYGNKEFYPGQTAPLFVVVQNEGYLQSLSGFSTQESLVSQNSLALSASETASSSGTSAHSSDYTASASDTDLSSGYVGTTVASGDVSVTNANSASISGTASRSYSDSYWRPPRRWGWSAS